MSLRPCRSCGRIDPHRMIALMTHWFGKYAEVPPEGGYFYLCPSCHERLIDPFLEEIRHRLASEHPAVRRLELPHLLITRGPMTGTHPIPYVEPPPVAGAEGGAEG